MNVKTLVLTLKHLNLREGREETHSAQECVDISVEIQNQKMLETLTLESTKRYASGSVGLVLTGINK
jgi:hypothetical protein